MVWTFSLPYESNHLGIGRQVSTLYLDFMKSRSYSENDLKEAIASSRSIRQVLKKVGLKPAGGNYQTIRSFIKTMNLDTSHFTGKSWNKGLKLQPKRPIEDYLSNKYKISSYKLKLRLIKEGVFERRCYFCNQEQWLENPIPLELDHIDGNHQNNNLSNLQLICPNCHALTPNYRGKNKGNYSKS